MTGRPRKTIENTFPDNWKELVIGWSMEGLSEAEIRVELCKIKGVFCERLWYILKEREQEFMHTLQMCKSLRQAWWERKARTSLNDNSFQTGLWYACMKNMFGYRDKQEEKQDDSLINQELQFQAVPSTKEIQDRYARFLN